MFIRLVKTLQVCFFIVHSKCLITSCGDFDATLCSLHCTDRTKIISIKTIRINIMWLLPCGHITYITSHCLCGYQFWTWRCAYSSYWSRINTIKTGRNNHFNSQSRFATVLQNCMLLHLICICLLHYFSYTHVISNFLFPLNIFCRIGVCYSTIPGKRS